MHEDLLEQALIKDFLNPKSTNSVLECGMRAETIKYLKSCDSDVSTFPLVAMDVKSDCSKLVDERSPPTKDFVL